MKRMASALTFSGVLLLANWVQAPAAPVRDLVALGAADVADAEQAAQSLTPVARQIDQDADRLRQRLVAQVPFAEPARDPFRFKGKGSEPFSTESREKGSDPVVLKSPASPQIVMPVLVGVIEDVVDGVANRTAVLSMGDDMAIVKIGQSFVRFVVRAIGAASVELADVTSPNRTVVTITIR